MDENIKTLRREKWLKIVMEQKKSGLTITEWCRQNDIRMRQFHYWQKVLRDHALLDMKTDTNLESSVPACTQNQDVSVQVFAELPLPARQTTDRIAVDQASVSYGQDSGIMIRCQDLQIRIADSFNERALARVLQVVRNA